MPFFTLHFVSRPLIRSEKDNGTWTTPVRFVQNIMNSHICMRGDAHTFVVLLWCMTVVGSGFVNSPIHVLCLTCFHGSADLVSCPLQPSHVYVKDYLCVYCWNLLLKRFKEIMLRCTICLHLHFNILLSIQYTLFRIYATILCEVLVMVFTNFLFILYLQYFIPLPFVYVAVNLLDPVCLTNWLLISS